MFGDGFSGRNSGKSFSESLLKDTSKLKAILSGDKKELYELYKCMSCLSLVENIQSSSLTRVDFERSDSTTRISSTTVSSLL